MSLHIRPLLAAALVLSASTLCFAADQVDNPSYKSWAKFKPGTSVTLKNESDMGGNKSESEITTTLVSVSPEKAVIETKMSMVVAGNKMDMPAQSTDVPAKMDKPPADANNTPKPEVKESSETISVAGKEYKCKVTESKSVSTGMTTVSKTWTSEEIPGTMAKSETTMDGSTKGTSKMSVTAVTIK